MIRHSSAGRPYWEKAGQPGGGPSLAASQRLYRQHLRIRPITGLPTSFPAKSETSQARSAIAINAIGYTLPSEFSQKDRKDSGVRSVILTKGVMWEAMLNLGARSVAYRHRIRYDRELAPDCEG